jgi:alanine racemase
MEALRTPETSFLEINLKHLDHNVAALRALVESQGNAPHRDRPPLLCAVVKKNAYGLGATPIAQRLVRAGVHMLCVYAPSTAETLIRAAVNIPILVLMPVRTFARTDVLYRPADDGRLHLAVHDLAQLDQLNSAGQTLGIRLTIHLYLDTGMSRSGLDRDQFATALQRIPNLKHLKLRGVFSHLATACSDPDFAQRQLDYFNQVVNAHRGELPGDIVLHIANTCAAFRDHAFHLHMIRPGLGLYGYGPESLAPGPILADAPQLKPILRWVSRLIHVQPYPKGSPVGYLCTHCLKRDSLLGVVPVGYGDGYPLALSNRAAVELPTLADPALCGRPALAPVLGRVNMDQIVIDLTDAAAIAGPDALTLDLPITLVSDDSASPCALPHLADLAGSSVYEMLCRLAPDLPRRYLH